MSAPTIKTTPTSRTTNNGPCVGSVPALGGTDFLAASDPAMAMTGTENENINGHLKRFRRARVTLNVGKPFFLQEQADRQAMMRDGTRQIMESLAKLLPESYRGNYK